MRIVLLSETYSNNMGYASTALSKALARLGADVHLLTLSLSPYYYLPDFQQTYGSFIDVPPKAPAIERIDGYNVHFLPHKKRFGYMRMEGLFGKLKSLRPHIVQTFAAISWIPIDAALAKPILRYKLFTGSHTTASVFPLARRQVPPWDRELLKSMTTRAAHGRFVSLFTEKCYGATEDCSDIAVRFFGVQKHKINTSPLGVDTDVFFPIKNEESGTARVGLRKELGFTPSDIVCVYSGRFSDAKNPLLLARAIEHLASMGEPFRGLFIGNGTQATAIEACRGCVVHPFIPFYELGNYFRAAEIGVWPTQESTSMLDAAACGIPIVVNDTLVATERLEGNGVTYRLNDLDDLVRALQSLRDPAVRNILGQLGAEKMANRFSWISIAKRRLRDYEAAMTLGNGS